MGGAVLVGGYLSAGGKKRPVWAAYGGGCWTRVDLPHTCCDGPAMAGRVVHRPTYWLGERRAQPKREAAKPTRRWGLTQAGTEPQKPQIFDHDIWPPANECSLAADGCHTSDNPSVVHRFLQVCLHMHYVWSAALQADSFRLS